MRSSFSHRVFTALGWLLLLTAPLAAGRSEETAIPSPKAFLDGTGTGWRDLAEADFMAVNCDPKPGAGKMVSFIARVSRLA